MIRTGAAIFLFVLLLPVLALSQTHIWSQSFGDDVFSDGAEAMVVDGSGNIFLTGSFWGTVDFGGGDLASNANTGDIFLARFDANGVHQWSQRFGSASAAYETGESLALDGSGNVVLTGYFDGTVNFGGSDLVSVGGGDLFVAKFDADGVHQWSLRAGGATSIDRGESVVVDPSGNVLLAGFFMGTINFGGGNLVSAGNTDVYVAKFDAGGVHQWSKRFGSTGFDDGSGVAVDGSGNVAVTGTFAGSVNFGGGALVSAGGYDIFLAKFDAAGTHQWSQRFGSPSDDSRGSIAMDGAGSMVVASGFAGTVNFGGGDLVSAGGTDAFVAKYDASGAHLWSERVGGAGTDYAGKVAIDASGDVAIAGNFLTSASGAWGGLASAGSRDIFVATYDASGAHQWIRVFGSRDNEFVGAVAMDGSGNVLLAGSFFKSLSFGGNTLFSEGGLYADIFLAKLGPPVTGVGDGAPSRDALTISSYPNPFNPVTTIHYTLPWKGRVSVAVYGARGQRVATLVDAEKDAGPHTIAWSGRDDAGRAVSSGVYFARVRHGSETKTYKMVLLK